MQYVVIVQIVLPRLMGIAQSIVYQTFCDFSILFCGSTTNTNSLPLLEYCVLSVE
jgi:hypothetical protein